MGAFPTATGAAICNAALVDLGGEVLLFDSFLTPKAAKDLRRVSEHLFGRPPGVVVNSHYHWDHMRGNQVFPEARVVGTTGTRERVLTRGKEGFAGEVEELTKALEEIRAAPPPRTEDQRFWEGFFREALEAHPTLSLVAPSWTFDSEMVLDGSRRRVRLLTYGGGHSGSDAFAYLPEEKLLLMGDQVMVGVHPSLGDGNPEELIETLQKVERLPCETVFPGHGSVGGGEEVGRMRRYVEDLLVLARDMVERGRTADDVATTPVPKEHADRRLAGMFRENLSFLLARAAAARP